MTHLSKNHVRAIHHHVDRTQCAKLTATKQHVHVCQTILEEHPIVDQNVERTQNVPKTRPV